MKILKNFILILSAIIVFGSVFFYIWKLNGWVYLGFIVLLGLLIYWRYRRDVIPRFNRGIQWILQSSWRMTKETPYGIKRKTELRTSLTNLIFKLSNYLAPVIFTGSIILILYYFTRHRSGLPIRSPWEVVSWKLFVLYGIAAASLFVSLISKLPKWLKAIFVFVFTFLSFGTALILYKIGYGFDPFIHRATAKHIAEFGTITPKPFYYIGQYALVLFFHKIFFIPIAWADKLLVPFLASITLPILFYSYSSELIGSVLKGSRSPAWHRLTQKIGSILRGERPSCDRESVAIKENEVDSVPEKQSQSISFLVALCAVLLPFSAFIATTPQSLANLFLLALIFIVIISRHSSTNENSSQEKNFWNLDFEIWILTATAVLLIHPLSGIPALLFLGIIILTEKLKGWQKYLAGSLAVIFGSVILPLVFIIRDKTAYQFNLSDILPSVRFFIENKFDLFRNFVYLYKFNFWLIFLILAAIGFGVLIYKKQGKTAVPLVLTSIIIFLNAVFLKIFVNFPGVIIYEQGEYTARLVAVASFFLYPLTIIPAAYFFSRVVEGKILTKIFAVIFITYLAVSSFYISYPRVDKYESTHGFGTSQFDINAVKFIEEQAAGKKYIVMANQAVSAAALQEFGFKDRYYKIVKPNALGAKETYFYPVPTGGILYQYYLKMVYDAPTKLNASPAAALVGAEEIYLVINSYWTNARSLVRQAKENSDEWWVRDNGRIYIFKYLPIDFESKSLANK